MDMLDIAKKTMLTGIGLALVAKDEVEGVVKDFQEKLNMSEKDGKKFFWDFIFSEVPNPDQEPIKMEVK